MARKSTDEEFAAAWRLYQCSPDKVAKHFGIHVRNVFSRRLTVERNLGIVLPSADDRSNRASVSLPKKGYRHILKDFTGTIIVFSDLHPWPGEERTVGFEALITLINELKPKAIIGNGDILDGASISRHPPVGWVNTPDLADELAYCKELMAEIAAAAPADCELRVCAGNHDGRFTIRLAMQAPEYVRVEGTDLKDHFPDWEWAWSAEVNDNTIIKHRWHQGVHAAWNNVLKGGRNMVTSHTHRLQVKPYTDYNGTRYAVETGTLSDWGPEHDKFTWAEDSPFNWQQGFAVLTFDEEGRMLQPEVCSIHHGTAYFRGRPVSSAARSAKRSAKRKGAA